MVHDVFKFQGNQVNLVSSRRFLIVDYIIYCGVFSLSCDVVLAFSGIFCSYIRWQDCRAL